MFDKESIRIVLGSVIGITILFFIMSFFKEKKKYEYQYKPGECYWHINFVKNPDGTDGRDFYKIIRTIEIEGQPYYITDVLNWHYRFDNFSPKLGSADYVDKYHPKYTHKEKCQNGIRKDLVEKCIQDKNWQFSTGGVKCPTREEFCKQFKEKTGEDCWKKK